MKPPRIIRAADLFCGAGGTSTGLSRACQALPLCRFVKTCFVADPPKAMFQRRTDEPKT
jgi:site-specific DNA-cytosine methylase